MSSNTPTFASGVRCSGGIFMIIMAMITAMNDTPLNAKHAAGPHNPYTTPPSAGPITRARLNCIEFMATAFGTSCRFTRSGSSDAYAGPLNDCALPVRNDINRMCQICSVFV